MPGFLQIKNPDMKSMVWFFLVISILLGAFGQIFMKEAMKTAGPIPLRDGSAVTILYYFRAFISISMILAVLSYGVSFIIWLGVLSVMDLSLARPLMSAGYLITMVYGFYAGESLTVERIAGTLLIVAGIFFLTKNFHS